MSFTSQEVACGDASELEVLSKRGDQTAHPSQGHHRSYPTLTRRHHHLLILFKTDRLQTVDCINRGPDLQVLAREV